MPDIMCFAKALTNGMAPMGATITTAAIADDVAGELEAYSTYGWHPLACEAALATLEMWKADEPMLLAQVAERSDQFADRIADRRELPSRRPRDHRRGQHLSLFPALTIDRKTADQGLDILPACIADAG